MLFAADAQETVFLNQECIPLAVHYITYIAHSFPSTRPSHSLCNFQVEGFAPRTV